MDATKENIKTIVVLGAGRSGTSLLCGILSILGADFGKRLIPADASNPRGYFESYEFIKLNESIYTKFRAKDDMHPILFEDICPYREINGAEYEGLMNRLLYSRYSAIYGLKAWRAPMIELAIPYLKNPVFVVVKRDLEDTAKSLEQHVRRRKNHRNIAFEECKLITQEYQAEVDKVLERHADVPVINVTFEELIEDVEQVVRKLGAFLQVDIAEYHITRASDFVLPSKMERSRMSRRAALLSPFRRFIMVLQKLKCRI